MARPRSALIALIFAFSVPLSVMSEPPELRVGVSLPLTGDLAEYGTAVRNGLEMSKSPQSDIHYIYEDNQYDAAKAVAAFHKLRTNDNIDLLFNWGEPPLHAIAPLAEAARIPVLAMSLDPEPANGKEFIQLTINPAEEYAARLIEYLRSHQLKRIGIIQTEDPFLASMVAGIRRSLREDETLEVVATFTPEDNDFRSHVARLKAKNFDIVGVYLFTGQVSSFFRQAHAQAFAGPFFGTDFFESRSEIARAGGAMRGAIYPNLRVPPEFASRYAERFHSDAEIAYAYNSYEVGLQINRANQSSRESEGILKLLRASGSTFSVARTPGGASYYKFPLVIKIIDGEGFKEVD